MIKTKRNIIIALSLGSLLVIGIVCFLLWPKQKKQTNSGGYFVAPQDRQAVDKIVSEDTPQELSAEDKEKLVIFARAYAGLYNSYGYDDYDSLTSLIDYQTASMQNANFDRIALLKSQTPPGYLQIPQINLENWQFSMLPDNQILVILPLKIDKYSYDNLSDSYNIELQIIVTKTESGFLVAKTDIISSQSNTQIENQKVDPNE